MPTIEEQIAKHQYEIDLLREEQKRLATLTPEQALAESLHETQCRWNHTDGCSWLYEVHHGVVDWEAYAHAEYLKRAKKVMSLLPGFTADDIMQVANALKGQ